MTSYIIFAFVSGFLLATVIFWIVTNKLKEGWQAEYRRLMGGIEKAYKLIELGNVGQAMRSLSDVYYDKPNWPRK